MAFSFQSPGHVNSIGPIFYGPQEIKNVHSTCAWHLNHLDIGRIGKAHGTRQIRGCISTVITAVGNNLWFKYFVHFLSSGSKKCGCFCHKLIVGKMLK
jgi:hypothetical protein